MITLFTGAGASKAVSTDDYPTTIDFFEKIAPKFKDIPFFNFIVNYCKSSNNETDSTIDIEKVLWNIQSLISDINSMSDRKSLLSSFFLDQQIKSTIKATDNFKHVINQLPNILRNLDDLLQSINSEVYKLYSKTPTFNSVESNYLYLIENLLYKDSSIKTFTTNYDLVLEEVINYLGLAKNEFQDHRSIGTLSKLDLDYYRNFRLYDDASSLTKLHGSVDWRLGDDGNCYYGQPFFSGDLSKHMIIYPGFKGKPSSEPFIAFHEYLKHCLERSNMWIFIGFAFRDEFINEIIDKFAIGKKIIILNPMQIERNFPSSTVIRLLEPFNKESTEKVIEIVEQT